MIVKGQIKIPAAKNYIDSSLGVDNLYSGVHFHLGAIPLQIAIFITYRVQSRISAQWEKYRILL
jgi:hypothetical protein